MKVTGLCESILTAVTVQDAYSAGHHQMRLFGRPAFIVDGIALALIVELTGHRVHGWSWTGSKIVGDQGDNKSLEEE